MLLLLSAATRQVPSAATGRIPSAALTRITVAGRLLALGQARTRQIRLDDLLGGQLGDAGLGDALGGDAARRRRRDETALLERGEVGELLGDEAQQAVVGRLEDGLVVGADRVVGIDGGRGCGEDREGRERDGAVAVQADAGQAGGVGGEAAEEAVGAVVLDELGRVRDGGGCAGAGAVGDGEDRSSGGAENGGG